MFNSMKNEINFIRQRMYMLGLKRWHLFTILSLEIIGWTLVFVLGYKCLTF